VGISRKFLHLSHKLCIIASARNDLGGYSAHDGSQHAGIDTQRRPVLRGRVGPFYGLGQLSARMTAAIIQVTLLHQDRARRASSCDPNQPTEWHGGSEAPATGCDDGGGSVPPSSIALNRRRIASSSQPDVTFSKPLLPQFHRWSYRDFWPQGAIPGRSGFCILQLRWLGHWKTPGSRSWSGHRKAC
jgi:hypothetical protein